MSGVCSAHQGHDKDCPRCTAIPLTPEQEAYYRGWDAARAAQLRNCWTPVENCVLNAYTRLEDAARKSISEAGDPDLEKALDDIDHLRELKRGMWGRDLPQ
jgi:hypothetical protein